MPRPPAPPFDPAVARLIRRKAARLVGTHGLTAGDLPDIQQELAMHLTSSLARHDVARSSLATFADRVLRNRSADVARHAARACRDRRRERQLSFADGVAAPGLSAGRAALVLDVRQAVAALPPDLRAVAVLLMDASVAEVARRTGRTRQQVRTLVARLADHLRPLASRTRTLARPAASAAA
ncbi:MAG TPA: hypothetical protein VF796_21925 [Humisphaera sp.]